jgi:hypothetical protein
MEALGSLQARCELPCVPLFVAQARLPVLESELGVSARGVRWDVWSCF